jgi:peptidoglycan/xylan/chitin deacetylase (PgdA/CDA1 family)
MRAATKRTRWTRWAVAAVVLGLTIVAVWSFVLIHSRKPDATILMYHSVTDDDGAPEPSIGRTLFERQMEFVARHGYQTVFVKDVVARYETKAPVPSRWLALTFDGGYPDFYTNVYPVLRRYRLKATLYVVVSDIGMPGGLGWDQLREMKASGLVAIGSHSWDHAADDCLPLAEARREKARSKAALEANLGAPIVTYAYPYGAFSRRAKRLLEEEGYRGAVGTVYRRGEFDDDEEDDDDDDDDDDVFNLRRAYVSRSSRFPGMFRFMLSGYYVPTRSLILRLVNVRTPREIGCPRHTPPAAAR